MCKLRNELYIVRGFGKDEKGEYMHIEKKDKSYSFGKLRFDFNLKKVNKKGQIGLSTLMFILNV